MIFQDLVSGETATAESDIATIVTMLQSIWDTMSNDMGGPPLPDAYGPNVPAEYGGDARIDFYAVHLGQIVYRDGPKQIPKDAAAATKPAPPFTNADGTPRNASSAFMLMNVDRLEKDAVSFKLDLIHEFFHALQDAHNYRATVQGTTEHWFVEASAVWAETYYLRTASWQPHGWFFAYQNDRLSLQSPDQDHQYASYIWPFFMEQEKGAQAILDAWKQTDPIAPHDFDAMTAAVSAQLSFDGHFRDFAVRNLDLNEVLGPAREKRYHDRDASLPDDVPPFAIVPANVSPGSPYVSADQSIPDLAAWYFGPEFSDNARKVTISLAHLQPSGQVDGDFLAHYADGSWKRIPVQGGGAKDKCEKQDVLLHGTFIGHGEDSLQSSDATFDFDIVWHRPDNPNDPLNFELVSGSFTFDTTVVGVCAGTLSEGERLERPDSEHTQVLRYGDAAQGSRYASVQLSDRRLDNGTISMALAAHFDVPNSSADCQPPFQPFGDIPICPMQFKPMPDGTLQTDSSCEDSVGTKWTGHIAGQQ